MSATGETFAMDAIYLVLASEQGQIAHHWGMADTIGTVGQLGLLPAPGQAPASISGRASAEQSGFRGGGRGGRSPTSPAFWLAG